MEKFFFLVSNVLVLALQAAPAWSEQDNSFLQQAVSGDERNTAEVARDINRKPIETLTFFGLQPAMTVVELLPGAGWYSKILSAAVADKGHYYAAIGTDRLAKDVASRVELRGETSDFVKLDRAGYVFRVDKIDLGVKAADMVLTFRNAHNFNADTRLRLNRAVFDALKPGGVYGIIDHSKRHMESPSDATWRRLDPVMVIHEALQAGFVFEGFSDLHARPEDSLRYDTRHDSLVNESDRFTLKFRKPLD